MVVIKDERPMLIDSGFGSDVKRTEQLLIDAGVTPDNLHLIVNTHYHSDHVGGNYYFQKTYETKIAAHKWEANLVNRCDREACTAEWLDQPIEPYYVNRKLSDFDEIDTGKFTWQVIHTPGHTLGHIALYEPTEQVLIAGDLFHQNDIGWINLFREGAGAIDRSLESLDRIAKLKIEKAYSGHGTAILNPQEAIDSARRRYEKYVNEPEKIAWHAVKRIFAYALMIKDGLKKEQIEGYLLKCRWFQDFARHFFNTSPEQFVQPLLQEMIRSKGATWKGEYLVATAPFETPSKEWIEKDIQPKDWKKTEVLSTDHAHD